MPNEKKIRSPMSGEPALAGLASEVDDARDALLLAARTRPGHAWTVDELLDVTNGHWRDSVVMIALDQLLASEELAHDSAWRILLRPSQ